MAATSLERQRVLRQLNAKLRADPARVGLGVEGERVSLLPHRKYDCVTGGSTRTPPRSAGRPKESRIPVPTQLARYNYYANRTMTSC